MALTSDVGVAEALSATSRTANATTAAIDTWAHGRPSSLVALLSIGARSGTTPTLDVKIQDSADGTTFADVPGGAFPQQTNVGFAERTLHNFRRYVRVVGTVGGTSPNFTYAVILVFGDPASAPI